MAGRLIEDEADARACLEAAGRAGGELTAWARANGIDGRSLRGWRLHFERRGEHEPKVGAQSASVVELVPTATTLTTAARYALDFGDVRFEFDDSCTTSTLRRVLEALRAC